MYSEFFKTELEDEHVYSIRLLQEFGKPEVYLTPEKIRELWDEYRKHDTLFSDYTRGKVDPFLDALFNSFSVWAEVYDETDDQPIGAFMISDVIPNFDAKGHFTFWDSKASGREPLVWRMMKFWMTQFSLHRLSAEVPGHQRGVIRFIERLGFEHEGTRREGNIHKGSWVNMEMFGILQEELDERLKENGDG